MPNVYVMTVRAESSEKMRGKWEDIAMVEEIYQSLSSALYDVQSLRDLPHRVVTELSIKRVEVPLELYRQYFRRERES